MKISSKYLQRFEKYNHMIAECKTSTMRFIEIRFNIFIPEEFSFVGVGNRDTLDQRPDT